MEIKTEEVNYFKNINGYLASPNKEGSYGGVVMIHENRGLNEGIKEYAEKLAEEGYLVLAIDLFQGETVPTVAEGMALMAKFDQGEGIENMRAAVAYLREKGAHKVGSIGWCFGGAQSLKLATSGEQMNGTVIYYGRLVADKEELSRIKWPVLGIFAGNDGHITPEHVEEFKKNLDELGIENDITIYPGVDHAFANPSNPQFAPKETEDAWNKTLEFLKKNLK
ncbi:MAG: carboxymethylenebutenolidase [Candidatus Nomurabacteria bacterium]|nr:carboxymethylenebutenolidase [Candidatus Nomurabacteria bacterium]